MQLLLQYSMRLYFNCLNFGKGNRTTFFDERRDKKIRFCGIMIQNFTGLLIEIVYYCMAVR